MKNLDLPRSSWENLANEWILNQRDREIFKRRYLDGIKFEDLAEEFQLSERQIKTIAYKTMEKISQKLH